MFVLRIFAAVVAIGLTMNAGAAMAFCGFYVARGDADLFNDASKVVMVRDGNRTVITMVNDFRGDVKDFAMVIPSPMVLKRNQINVGESSIVEHLDAYTAPRLVEYHDGDPCQRVLPRAALAESAPQALALGDVRSRAKSFGVTIEEQYTVGEYDILILSARESDGLLTWLVENGYRLPAGAAPVLGDYIAKGMKFFVAKVNLEALAETGNSFLRPLQLAFESRNFMLPIRLGMLNANGKQDLLLWTLTRRGRVETANYPTVKMPTGDNVPTYVKKDFGPVYKALFARSVEREGGSAVLMEYAWDMGWCDPCAADPLSAEELRKLGVFWVQPESGRVDNNGRSIRPPQGVDVFVTRLHARYDAQTFPEDLRLRVTDDRQNFQGRYVLNHPWTGKADCPAGKEYLAGLPDRFESEAQTLARLTGWRVEDIRAEMKLAGQATAGEQTWWDRLWDD